MSESLQITNSSSGSSMGGDKIDVQTFELPQNYSILLNKLEQLALGLESTFANLSLDRKEVEITVGPAGGGGSSASDGGGLLSDLVESVNSGRHHSVHNDAEYARVVSDIWIGVILTLLIVTVIFFICSCFLYHKFQQWKNSYRTNPNDPVELCRHCPPDFEAESLPSYTIVSGLPTYDDALEEFRKAGIILAPTMPVIKIFETESKENQLGMALDNQNSNANNTNANAGNINDIDGGDNISISSTCTCGANAGSSGALMLPSQQQQQQQLQQQQNPQGQIIELSPEQLAILSRKRLSLQIAFNNSMRQRRNSRPRVDLYREVNRNNMLRSRAMSSGSRGGNCPTAPSITSNATTANSGPGELPPIHRSSSSGSLFNEYQLMEHRRLHQQHRGSLC